MEEVMGVFGVLNNAVKKVGNKVAPPLPGIRKNPPSAMKSGMNKGITGKASAMGAALSPNAGGPKMGLGPSSNLSLSPMQGPSLQSLQSQAPPQPLQAMNDTSGMIGAEGPQMAMSDNSPYGGMIGAGGIPQQASMSAAPMADGSLVPQGEAQPAGIGPSFAPQRNQMMNRNMRMNRMQGRM